MALPSAPSSISMDQVRDELGVTGSIGLGDSAVRALAGQPSGQVTMWHLRGKSAAFNVTSTISTPRANLNLMDYISDLGWDGSKKLTGTITLTSYIYSTSTSSPALMIERMSIPPDSDLTFRIASGAYVAGAGGRGGQAVRNVPNSALNGLPGGDAIQVSGFFPIPGFFRIYNQGWIGSGGGGGGGQTMSGPGFAVSRGGGGGAGRNAGSGGPASDSTNNYVGGTGTLTAGGAGGNNSGADGGGRGEKGIDAQLITYVSGYGLGGAPGTAVSNYDMVLWTGGDGTIYGPITG